MNKHLFLLNLNASLESTTIFINMMMHMMALLLTSSYPHYRSGYILAKHTLLLEILEVKGS